jgi:hypothetical protein
MSAHLNQEMALLLYPREVPDKHGAAKLNDDFIVSLFMDNCLVSRICGIIH